jgi:hypothetical protein
LWLQWTWLPPAVAESNGILILPAEADGSANLPRAPGKTSTPQNQKTAARQKIRAADLERQIRGVWFDHRLVDRIRDEAPEVYKDIHAVIRANAHHPATSPDPELQGRLNATLVVFRNELGRWDVRPRRSKRQRVVQDCA